MFELGAPHNSDLHSSQLQPRHQPVRKIYDAPLDVTAQLRHKQRQLRSTANSMSRSSAEQRDDFSHKQMLNRRISNPLKVTSKLLESKLRRTLDNGELQRLCARGFDDNDDADVNVASGTRHDVARKSASLGLSSGYVGSTNPIYSDYPAESPTHSIKLPDTRCDESSTDVTTSDVTSRDKAERKLPRRCHSSHEAQRNSTASTRHASYSGASSQNRAAPYDVTGLQKEGAFPWQREQGVQCTLIEQDRRPLEATASAGAETHAAAAATSVARAGRPLRPSSSLDSSRKRQPPAVNRKLHHIVERDSGRGVSVSSSSADESEEAPSSRSVTQAPC